MHIEKYSSIRLTGNIREVAFRSNIIYLPSMQWCSTNHLLVDKQTFKARFFFFLRVIVEVVGLLEPQVG